MADEVVKRFQKFALSEGEDLGVIIEKEDYKGSQEESERSLIGRIHGEKRVSYQGLKNTMQGLWKVNGELGVRELGPNIFQFIFSSKDDRQKVVNGRSWTFDGYFLVLRYWEEGQEKCMDAFRFTQIWVQVWEIPNNWISKAI